MVQTHLEILRRQPVALPFPLQWREPQIGRPRQDLKSSFLFAGHLSASIFIPTDPRFTSLPIFPVIWITRLVLPILSFSCRWPDWSWLIFSSGISYFNFRLSWISLPSQSRHLIPMIGIMIMMRMCFGLCLIEAILLLSLRICPQLLKLILFTLNLSSS